MKLKASLLSAQVLGLAISLLTGSATGTDLFVPTNECTGINCGSRGDLPPPNGCKPTSPQGQFPFLNCGVVQGEVFSSGLEALELAGLSPHVVASTKPGFLGHKPWVAQLYTGGTSVFTNEGECIRVDVQGPAINGPKGADAKQLFFDLEATLTCPDGETFQNDDRNPGALLPLIKAVYMGKPGWCTLTISNFEGSNVNTSFGFFWGRYRGTNPNCCGTLLNGDPDPTCDERTLPLVVD